MVKVSDPKAFSMARSQLVNKGRKLNRLTVREKLSILKRFEKGERQCDIVKSTGLSRSVVSRIKKESDTLRNIEKGNSNLLNSKFIDSEYTPKYTKVGQSVYHWFVQNRRATDKRKRLPITRSVIQARAKRVAQELGLVGFTASNGWFQGWLSRYNLGKSVKIDDEDLEPGSTNSSDEPVLVSTSSQPPLQFAQRGTPNISLPDIEQVHHLVIKHTGELMDLATRLRDTALIEQVRNYQTAAKTFWNIKP